MCCTLIWEKVQFIKPCGAALLVRTGLGGKGFGMQLTCQHSCAAVQVKPSNSLVALPPSFIRSKLVLATWALSLISSGSTASNSPIAWLLARLENQDHSHTPCTLNSARREKQDLTSCSHLPWRNRGCWPPLSNLLDVSRLSNRTNKGAFRQCANARSGTNRSVQVRPWQGRSPESMSPLGCSSLY